MDVRFHSNAVFQIVGPSGCGKTLFTIKLLLNKEKMFTSKIKMVHWLVGSTDGEHGDTLKDIKQLKGVKFYQGFVEGWDKQLSPGDCIVIDDLFVEASTQKNFSDLFTKIARHRSVTVIFITQNMFHQGGQHRTRNLNVHYLVLFKNPRDQTVVDYVARQAFPKNKRFLVDAYHEATANKPHGYLLIDFTQQCPDEIRVRTDIFSDKVVVYKQL